MKRRGTRRGRASPRDVCRALHVVHCRQARLTHRVGEAAVVEVEQGIPGDARVHYELAYAALLAKRYQLSIEHFKKSIAIEPREYLSHYNLACAYALTGDADSALTELQLAVDSGYADPVHMAQDPDLTILRDLPAFQELLRELSEKNR